MRISDRWLTKLWALGTSSLQARAAKGRRCGCKRCFACAAEEFRQAHKINA